MAALKKKREINLVPQDRFASSITGRLLSWLLKSFRIIVMVVEMVVMIAFLSRFWLDAKNSDLTDEIKQKSALIEAQASFEEDFRNTQKKIAAYKTLSSKNALFSEEIEKVTSALPPEVFVESISVKPKTISIGGLSIFEKSISQFIVNLRDIEGFERVQLTAIDSASEDQYLEFSLEVNKNGD